MFSRSRTCSESSEGGEGRPGSPVVGSPGGPGGVGGAGAGNLVAYDIDGKFSYSKVLKATLGNKMKTTIDENGKFNYVSADMRPVPPGWYDVDKTKHKVPVGWYDATKK
ncbi:uncharacterized protein LOC111717927 [Eurytemora carolleeae]|uniref:uncharacterized protein LOC111717927 n=1 Tax=Eurytemora carolleeae TaxID=1294199 RepID=UPI000C792D17|nr:uncharacterized protein LOC111717927 [Eurytemora carolleeae]|eukprot:XP_023349164.1 uncharacterized protein LOC111717927 [Eurytemora affinis]